jgi:hypothetical protein
MQILLLALRPIANRVFSLYQIRIIQQLFFAIGYLAIIQVHN